MTKKSALFKTALLTMTFSALAACSEGIGADAETQELRGDISSAPLVDGATNVDVVTLNASALRSGESYKMSQGVLVINGDVPAKTKINVGMGRIIVNGNVGTGAKVSAWMPEDTHSETYTCMMYNAALKMSTASVCSRTVRDNLTFASDPTSGVIVSGNVAADATIQSNAGVQAQCVDETSRLGTDWSRPVRVSRVGHCSNS